jgi:hypothetical protein
MPFYIYYEVRGDFIQKIREEPRGNPGVFIPKYELDNNDMDTLWKSRKAFIAGTGPVGSTFA